MSVMRVAIAHEWIDQRAGSEKTFERLARIVPTADLYTLTARPSVQLQVGGRPIRTSYLNRSHRLRNRRDLTLPLMPVTWRYMTRERYDLVITSTHSCARGFRPGRQALHLSYCHTPMRYAWLPDIDGRAGGTVPAAARAALRSWDRRSARWVDFFAANSASTAERIARFYERDSRVIYPPVDVDFYAPGTEPREDFVLAVSRFIPYKRLDLAIRACASIGMPLVIAGSGPDEGRLRELAAEEFPGGVRFEISPSDLELRELYRTARALVFPAYEDFGIVPVEAQACGTPVVALNRGGTMETIVSGVTGVLAEEQTAWALGAALEQVVTGADMSSACRRNAERFGAARFDPEISDWLNETTGMDLASLRDLVLRA